jgi:hypothetical protein
VPINKKVVGGIENLLNRFQRTATDKPLTFGAYEITSASGSAIGAYIAERYGPASMVERGGAEILGGVGGSLATSAAERAGRLIYGGGKFIANVYGGPRTTGEGVLRGGRYSEQFDKSFPGLVDFFKGADKKKTKAAQEILGRIIEAGENPDEIIRLLNDPANAEAINSAVASRSPILQVIEAALMRDNQKLAKGSQQAYQETRAALRTNMMELVALGDIDSLVEAAKIQQTLFEDALETRLGSATNAVLDAADKLRGDGTPLSPEELAEKLYDTVNQSIKVARAQEKSFVPSYT